MKVWFLLSNRQPPSSRLRVTGLVQALERRRRVCTVRRIPSDPPGRLRMIRACGRHDVGVFQGVESLLANEYIAVSRKILGGLVRSD